MRICLPHDDEYARGHVGRFRLINRLTGTYLDTSKAIRETVISSGLKPNNKFLAANIACLMDMPFEDYLLRHTFMNIHPSIVRRGKVGDWKHSVIKRISMANLRDYACFCEQCVQSDMEKLGYSYWRRSHQLPGVSKCTVHSESILTKVFAQTAFDMLPQYWMTHYRGHKIRGIPVDSELAGIS